MSFNFYIVYVRLICVINPEIHLNGTWLDDPEKSKNEPVELLSIFLKQLQSNWCIS